MRRRHAGAIDAPGSMERFGLDFGTTNTSLTRARGEALPVLSAIDPPAPDPRVLRALLYFSLEQRGLVVRAARGVGSASSTTSTPATTRTSS